MKIFAHNNLRVRTVQTFVKAEKGFMFADGNLMCMMTVCSASIEAQIYFQKALQMGAIFKELLSDILKQTLEVQGKFFKLIERLDSLRKQRNRRGW